MAERIKLGWQPIQIQSSTLFIRFHASTCTQGLRNIICLTPRNQLTSLRLTNCRLREFGGGGGGGGSDSEFHLPNLIHLDLSHNEIQRLPVAVHKSLPRLERLILTDNRLNQLMDLLHLQSIHSLLELDLSGGNLICVDRNRLNRILISRNTRLNQAQTSADQHSEPSCNDFESTISEEYCRAYCCYYLHSLQIFNRLPITNRERQSARERFSQDQAHKLSEQLVAAKCTVNSLINRTEADRKLLMDKEQEMEEIRMELAAIKQQCQRLNRDLKCKSELFAGQIVKYEQKILELNERLESSVSAREDYSTELLPLKDRHTLDMLKVQVLEMETLLKTKDKDITELENRLARLMIDRHGTAPIVTLAQQIDASTQTETDLLLKPLLISAVSAAFEDENISPARRSDAVEKQDHLIVKTLSDAFKRVRESVQQMNDDEINELQTERELLTAEIQTLRELMAAKDQRLDYLLKNIN